MRAVLPLLMIFLPTALPADAPLIVIDQSQLPFDLGPGHPANSPASTPNSPNAATNSAGNPANAASTWNNRPSNPANERRLIITADGGVMGYYAPSQSGVLNLFDVNGRRIAYRPASGTRSLFASDGSWCGTVDGTRTDFVLAVTPACAAKFRR